MKEASEDPCNIISDARYPFLLPITHSKLEVVIVDRLVMGTSFTGTFGVNRTAKVSRTSIKSTTDIADEQTNAFYIMVFWWEDGFLGFPKRSRPLSCGDVYYGHDRLFVSFRFTH